MGCVLRGLPAYREMAKLNVAWPSLTIIYRETMCQGHRDLDALLKGFNVVGRT